jgi:hypothetical protein
MAEEKKKRIIIIKKISEGSAAERLSASERSPSS